MFHTYPESQARISFELVPGRRTWNWFELACAMPIYLVHVYAVEAELTRQFVFSEFGQVLDSINKHPLTEEGGRLVAIYMIAPEQLSGEDHPVLVELAEVWAKPNCYNDLLYITRDEQRMRFALVSDPAPESELECALRIEPNHTMAR